MGNSSNTIFHFAERRTEIGRNRRNRRNSKDAISRVKKNLKLKKEKEEQIKEKFYNRRNR